ncbi:DUF1754-domain-containing protein [Ceratobasidium sp. AG-I]|nr:DUF1754-domain-containing protein [Ceratobasidium sp. AG-I]
MSDAYDFRPGGSLKLKGGGEKKKKHKSSSQKSSKKAILGDEPVAKAKPTETEDNRDSPAASGSRHESPAATSSSKPATSKTPAEIRFEETQRKRRLERVSKLASQTHKDRVHEFNSKLEALSEHHDIPKVGPG